MLSTAGITVSRRVGREKVRFACRKGDSVSCSSGLSNFPCCHGSSWSLANPRVCLKSFSSAQHVCHNCSKTAVTSWFHDFLKEMWAERSVLMSLVFRSSSYSCWLWQVFSMLLRCAVARVLKVVARASLGSLFRCYNPDSTHTSGKRYFAHQQ